MQDNKIEIEGQELVDSLQSEQNELTIKLTKTMLELYQLNEQREKLTISKNEYIAQIGTLEKVLSKAISASKTKQSELSEQPE